MSPAQWRAKLSDLKLERVAAAACGLTSCPSYMAELDAEEAECVQALIAATVTEIASLRAAVSGPLAG